MLQIIHRNLTDGKQRIGIMHVQVFESMDEWMQVSRSLQLRMSSIYTVVLNELVGEGGEKGAK